MTWDGVEVSRIHLLFVPRWEWLGWGDVVVVVDFCFSSFGI